MRKEKIEKLASERGNPCITISMNTPHSYPNNLQDVAELEKLLNEAHEHVVKEFGEFEVTNLLEKIDNLKYEIDFSYNLSSMHIFLSDSTTEIIKSSWATLANTVAVAENFVIKPLIKDFNRFAEYLILVISQTDVRLLHAINNVISKEIKNDDFNFTKNPYSQSDPDKSNDGKKTDNQIGEFFNQIDKAVVKIHHKTDLKVVVICSDNNWSRLKQVADIPSIYLGNVNISYNDTANHSLAEEAWKIVLTIQETGRAKAILEMQEAKGRGMVITDLPDIFVAVKEGRGDLLITRDDYIQPVKMTGQYTFDLATDVTLPGVIDDITSDIAWEVISKKGRAISTNQEEFNYLGNIALKVRY